MNKFSKILLVLIAIVSLSFQANSQNIFYTVGSDDTLRKVDVDTRTVLSQMPITVSGQVVHKLNGMAQHPTTGVLYAIVQFNGVTLRELISLDTITGVGTLIGPTGHKFSGIAFNNSSILYGVTGDGSPTPESLYTINLLTGAAIFVMSLGEGTDGEAIAFDSDDNTLYHASGNGTKIFETVTIPTSTDSIPLSGDAYVEITSLLYDNGGTFIGTSYGLFYSITTAGVFTALDTLSFAFNIRGLIRAGSNAGIDEPELLTVELVYPNPADDVVFIENTDLIGEHYTLVSMGGKVIQTGILSKELDVSTLNTGVYLLKLDDMPSIQLRVIKK